MTIAPQKVSPAHAGMDPAANLVASATIGFPRTRGDGPPEGMGGGVAAPFPPHTRGWTLCGGGWRRDRGVSPAHAGMDP